MLSLWCIVGLNAQNNAVEKVYYYDKDGKGVESEEFAAYSRHAFYSSNTNFKNRYKDYYKDGTLRAEGIFKTIDQYDDTKSIFEESKSFYYDGTVRSIKRMNNGMMECTTFYPNGRKESEGHQDMLGKVQGLVKTYSKDDEGIWTEYEVLDGKLTKSTPTYPIHAGNYTCDISYETGLPVDLRTPQPSDLTTTIINGVTYYGYKMNGLIIYAAADCCQDYAGTSGGILLQNVKMKDYVRINLNFWNVSGRSITLDPANMQFADASGKKVKPLEMIPFTEYMAMADKSLNFLSSQNAQEENAHARAMATTSRSYANTNAQSSSYAQGSSSSNISGRSGAIGGVVSSNGVGGFVAGSKVDGQSNSQYTNESQARYSSNAASESIDARLYKENLKEAEENIRSYNNNIESIRNGKYNAYMSPTTVDCLRSNYSYILTKNTKVTRVLYDITINGYTYHFDLPVNK